MQPTHGTATTTSYSDDDDENDDDDDGRGRTATTPTNSEDDAAPGARGGTRGSSQKLPRSLTHNN